MYITCYATYINLMANKICKQNLSPPIFYMYYELRVLVKLNREIPLKTMNDMLAALFCQYCIICQSMQEYDLDATQACTSVETV